MSLDLETYQCECDSKTHNRMILAMKQTSVILELVTFLCNSGTQNYS